MAIHGPKTTVSSVSMSRRRDPADDWLREHAPDTTHPRGRSGDSRRREIPGSSLEAEDDEDRRTWDEAMWADPPWGNAEADGPTFEPADDHEALLEDPALRGEWKLRRELEAEAAEIETRLATRPAPLAGAWTFDPDLERLEQIEATLETLAEAPPGWTPSTVEPHAHPAPTAPAPTPFEAALKARLTDEEQRHWWWIEEGHLQVVIATELGISQPAVAQRERKLRIKVDAIYQQVAGRSYPWPGGPGQPRRVGARRGRL
jgi:DNA-binding CsgD family transcriptional regulator